MPKTLPSADPAAISNGTYPYARELRLYVNKKRLSDAAKDFIRFVKLGNGQATLTSLGFVRRIEPKVWPPPSQPFRLNVVRTPQA